MSERLGLQDPQPNFRSLVAAIRSINELLARMTGRKTDLTASYVSFQDLIDMGVINPGDEQKIRPRVPVA